MKKTLFTLMLMTANTLFLYAQTATPDFDQARILMNSGKTAEAIQLLEPLLAADPENAWKTYYLAKAYSWENRWDDAIALYKRATELDSKKGEVYFQAKFGIAQVTGWQKKYSESVFLYAALINELGPKGNKTFIRDIYIGMGDSSSWNNDYDFALESYKHAAEADPTSADPLDRISKIYYWKHDYAASKQYAQKALALNPKLKDSQDRIKDIDLIKRYIIDVGSTTTLHSAKNLQNQPIRTEEVLASFTYKPNDDLKLNVLSKAYVQNYIETKNTAKSGGTHTDFLIGGGISNKFQNALYLGLDMTYVYNATIVPDFTAELNTGYKVSRIFDLVAMYRLTYDRIDSYQTDQKPVSHIFAPGLVLYFNPSFFIRGQCYMDTNFMNFMVSGFTDITVLPTPLDRADLYLSYGKGQNVMMFGQNQTRFDVVTMGIAGGYTHYFNSTFGLIGGISWTRSGSDKQWGFTVQTEFRL